MFRPTFRAGFRATGLGRRKLRGLQGVRGTATGIRTPVSAVRGRRPSPLDDGGAQPGTVAAGSPRLAIASRPTRLRTMFARARSRTPSRSAPRRCFGGASRTTGWDVPVPTAARRSSSRRTTATSRACFHSMAPAASTSGVSPSRPGKKRTSGPRPGPSCVTARTRTAVPRQPDGAYEYLALRLPQLLDRHPLHLRRGVQAGRAETHADTPRACGLCRRADVALLLEHVGTKERDKSIP